MRQLTEEEFHAAPPIIRAVFAATASGHPIGYQIITEAMDSHPEYFPDEVEHAWRWDSIPDEVHDAYRSEWEPAMAEIFKGFPKSKGFIYWAQHPDEASEWQAQRDLLAPKLAEKEKELRDKHYRKYLNPECLKK